MEEIEEIDAKDEMDERDAMKGLLETVSYKAQKRTESEFYSMLFSDKRKKCGVKSAGAGEAAGNGEFWKASELANPENYKIVKANRSWEIPLQNSSAKLFHQL